MKKLYLVSILLALFLPYVSLSQTTWVPYEYDISFKVKNAGISVSGNFTGLKMEIVFSPDKLSASKIKGSVDASTLTTGIGSRDKTVKDEKYLDVEKYKLIEGASSKLYLKGTDYAGLFNITIKGVTKEIEIPFQFNQIADQADFKGTFTLNRRDFNVGGSSMMMSDNVTVNILIRTKRQ